MIDVRHQDREPRWSVVDCILTHLVSLCVMLGLVAWRPIVALAQGGAEWMPLAVLYEGMVNSYLTALVSDPSGSAHLVWAPRDESAYYYSRWDGASWTHPIDILAPAANFALGVPSLVAARDGRLHLFWASDSVMHSWAWADAATSPRGWSTPEAVIVPRRSAAGPMDVKQDASGAFHVVYAVYRGDAYYAYSDAKGQDWSAPIQIGQSTPDVWMSAPRLDVGLDGQVHIVWNQYPAADGPAEHNEIFYTKTSDGGASWAEPVRFGELANSGINLLATADGAVYVGWQAGIASRNEGRFLQRSYDDGATWQEPLTLGIRRGQSGYLDMALDSQGVLHVITGDGEYAFWAGEGLSTPLDLRPVPEQTENTRLAIVNGNQLVVVIMPFWGPGLYYTVKNLPVPPLDTVTSVDRTPVSTLQGQDIAATARVPPTVEPAAGAVDDAAVVLSDTSRSSPAFPVVVGGTLSLALVAIVLADQLRRRYR